MITLCGAACVFIILSAQFFTQLTNTLNPCTWMIIVAVASAPTTWFRSPKEFWPFAVLALLATVAALVISAVVIEIDVHNATLLNCTSGNFSENGKHFNPIFDSITFQGFFTAFGTIMVRK